MSFNLDQMPVPMAHATYRVIRDCNAEFAALFGLERFDLIDQSFSRLYPKLADFVLTGDMWRPNLAAGRAYHDERVMIGAGGVLFWCRVNGRTLSDVDPFAEALYCYQRMSRPVIDSALSLTDRQRQVLTQISQGKTSAAIAAELRLSKRTIEAHRQRLMRAVGVNNGAELVAWFTGAPVPAVSGTSSQTKVALGSLER
ncbi:LuxR C-terminal-related transcriptional regulator [Devosia sp.]|uniref:helix-turn-helix transcriptional regulator n=1 Tax=Devosia sp. TaxID=1871048 RepID=UPI0026148858|nr:LuxR C-terminal-related transcriptional regulator [Devosia sp.]